MADFTEDFSEYAVSKLPTFREKFNYSTQALADASWVSSDTALIRVDPTNEELAFDWTNHSVSDRIYHDLGTAQSDTDWTLRCKATFSNVGEITINGYCIGLYDSNAQDSGVAQDFVMIFMSDVVALRFGDDVNLLGGTTSSSLTQPTINIPVFWELKRIGGTTFKLTQYSDSNYSVIIDSTELTGIPSTVNGLQFIKCLNRNDTGVGQITGTFEDIEFWNTGQQGDITFEDDFVLKPVTFSDDFSVDNWTTSNATFINVSGGVNNFDLPVTTTVNDGSIVDLGAGNISDTSWVLRAKLDITTYVTNTDATGQEIHMGISDSDQTVFSNASQDYIGLKFSGAGSSDNYDVVRADGIAPTTGGAIIDTFTRVPTVELIFIEIIRNSATNVTINQYSDSTYETLLESAGGTISGITGLRYIKIMAKNSDGTADGDITGFIDDLEFYNGTSTLTDWSGAIGNDVRLDTVNEIINFDPPTGVDRDELLAHDLQSSIGENADDENWTLRFKINTDTLVQGSSEEASSIFVGLDSNLDPTASATHDIMVFRLQIDQGGAGPQFGSISGSRFGEGAEYFGGGGGGTQFPTMWATGTKYIEVKRLSSTLMETTVYSDDNYTNIDVGSSGELLTVQDTITSTLVDLRYIRVTTDSSSVSNDTSLDGSIDDIEFYNGVSVPRTPVSELPILFEDRVDTDKGWVTTDGTAMAVNTGTQVLDIDVFRDGSQDAIAFDLGAGVLSETRWGLRFKYDIETIDPVNTGTKRIACGLFDTNQVASIGSPQDYIGITFTLATDTTNVSANATNNTNPQSNSFFKVFVNVITEVQTIYIEIIRISATSYSVEVFRDPDYSISIEKQTVDNISSAISGLRYIKFLGDETSGPVAGSFTGTIDDIQLWNDQAPLDHRNKWRVLDL